MTSTVDDIWDEPLVNSPPRVSRTADIDLTADDEEEEDHFNPRPSAKRRRSSLFLPATDDENSDDEPKSKPPEDIEALFDEDELTIAPAAFKPNREKQLKEAQARHARTAPSSTPYAIMPSSSPPRDVDEPKSKEAKDKDGKKPKKKVMRLDEGRLLGPAGFPQLIKDTKNFTPKGKGHEAADLNKLMQIYQFWTHKLYPKTQFKDTVDRVEKLTHSKRMLSSLSTWRDDAHGLINGRKPDEDVIDLTSDAEEAPGQTNSTHGLSDHQDVGVESDHAAYASSSSAAPSRPPSSSDVDMDEGDLDVDAMIQAEEDMGAERNQSNPTAKSVDEDDDMWAELDEAQLAEQPKNSAPNKQYSDDDEDMWDIVREMDGGGANTTATVVAPVPTAAQAIEDEWDDLYV